MEGAWKCEQDERSNLLFLSLLEIVYNSVSMEA